MYPPGQMFEHCQHGYVALTCPSCKGRPVSAAFSPATQAVAAPRADTKHYSGASQEARQELAGMWGDIMERTSQRVTSSQFRDGIQSGALKRREVDA